MKKIILAIILLINSLTLCAQTREETLKWIAEKVNAYGKDTFIEDFIYVDLKTDSVQEVFGSPNEVNWKEYSYSLNDITNYEILAYTDGAKLTFIRLYTRNKIEFIHHLSDKVTNNTTSFVDFWLHWDSEDDLLNRMKKALENLVRFNNATMPKEAY